MQVKNVRRTTQRVAQEAARIMTEDHVNDMAVARQKAMQRLGIKDRGQHFDNRDIECALRDYQRLFKGVEHSDSLNRLRQTALQAMDLLDEFSPRLVGPVLKGTANASTGVSLHVFSDSAEEIYFLLTDHSIPYEITEYRYQQKREQAATCPACRFLAGETEISLAIFPCKNLRQAPLSPVDDKPMQRGSRSFVEKLLTQPEF